MGNNYRSNNGCNTNIEEKVERKVKVIFKVLYNQRNELKIEEEGNQFFNKIVICAFTIYIGPCNDP